MDDVLSLQKGCLQSATPGKAIILVPLQQVGQNQKKSAMIIKQRKIINN